MTSICNAVTHKVAELLSAPLGVDSRVIALAEDARVQIHASKLRAIVLQNTPFDLAEKSLQAKYPAIYVYCDKLSNILKEKFRTFSGKAHVSIEIRYSQDRLEEIDRRLQLYVEAVCEVLDNARGDWGDGAFYTGGYEAVFGAVKQGGHNFLEVAKIGLEVEISR